MNCENFKEKSIDELAAGERELTGELAGHVRRCAACGAFYEEETKLFQAMSANLRAMVNQEMPASLLPRVRERLDTAATRRAWIYALVPAAAMVILATVVAGPLLRHSEVRVKHSVEYSSVGDDRGAEGLEAAAVAVGKIGGPPRPPALIGVKSAVPTNPRRKAATPEVLIDPDESRGLILLANTVYTQPKVGEALTRPVAVAVPISQTIAPQKIDPLEVANLEIRPLADEDR